MLFNSPEYLVFFVLLFAGATFTRGRGRHALLLAASYLFYGWWDWRFLALLGFSTCVDYFVGRSLVRIENPHTRRVVLGASLVTNLGMLAFFKYANFFIDSASALVGHRWLPHLHVILPIGISFFTFQSLSYTIDVFRRRIPAEKSFLRFALFLAFFPQLISGPITRASEFLGQYRMTRGFPAWRVSAGLQIFLIGFLKKCLFADRLAAFVDPVFAHPAAYDSATNWLALVAYAMQIFCDFSGYSDMAIGTALVFGYRLVENFSVPYVSLSITEFWRRWHRSLSRWLRDYLYVSLGGNRKGTARTYVNLALTMLIGGLWHGASWNFVLWGGMHGFALVIERLTGDFRERLERVAAGRVLLWAYTFTWTCLAWVLFRAKSFPVAWEMYGQLFRWTTVGTRWFAPLALGLLGIGVFAHWARLRMGARRYPLVNVASVGGAVLVGAAIFIALLGYAEELRPFLYFQF
jgi:alginate O-acetyltransferase complex protein AlgI